MRLRTAFTAALLGSAALLGAAGAAAAAPHTSPAHLDSARVAASPASEDFDGFEAEVHDIAEYDYDNYSYGLSGGDVGSRD
ncbi:hypothetical protein [Streptomyces minutiscleroticus]|uniref:Secreted protein n=1 Tax=Streptomyces minutiscleroticus TaxID=68238 RepID=A0A918NEH8_9ACTN|nr:hypothetical protein [Streptomyces minutiscleroticus]GGX66716.1 hypothetical protein GCM10010358_21530 [Streptomyces minutiscleroticus]